MAFKVCYVEVWKLLNYFFAQIYQDSEIRLVIIDNFSTIVYPKNEFSEYMAHIQEIQRLFKILKTIHYVGIIVNSFAFIGASEKFFFSF